MTWHKICDSFHGHPKTMELLGDAQGTKAVALWTLAGSWSAKHLTEGKIPRQVVKMYGSTAAANALVRVGLWKPLPDGYQFHDWLDYNPSRDQVLDEREAAKARVQRFRSRNKTRGNGDCNGVTHDATNATGNGDVSPSPDPDPVKEPPLVPPAGGKPPKPKRPRKRPATELPSDWKPSDDHRRIASSLGVDLDAEVSKFRDYCQANDRRYVDHDAALRQWLRKASEFRRGGNGRPPSGPGPVCPPEAHAAEPLPDFMRGAL